MDLNPDQWKFSPARLLQTLIVVVVVVLFLLALQKYKGDAFLYIIFSIVSNFLLYIGFRKHAIFFDTFIGIFFWLGFWLKLTVRVAFFDGTFRESVGAFDGSGEAFDLGIIATTCAFSGLIVASYIREIFFTYPLTPQSGAQSGLMTLYTRYRTLILLIFLTLVILVAVSNAYFGIYQRGNITQTILPYGLNGVFKWLILFGFASISALVLKFEYVNTNSKSYLVAVLVLLESCANNISLLSRGMILNTSALGFGFYKSIKLHRIRLKIGFLTVSLVVFLILFASSVIAVNYIRSNTYHANVDATTDAKKIISNTVYKTNVLFLDRWVGIEGILAVSSYPDKGWMLWREAMAEKYVERQLSFYDAEIIDSQYKRQKFLQHRFISLPGIVAFCFYTGSYLFLFLSMIAVGMFAFLVEWFVYRFGGKNLVLCALMSQVVAFRFASFGYVPAQSYLLFGALLLNVLLIYGADVILTRWYRDNPGTGS